MTGPERDKLRAKLSPAERPWARTFVSSGHCCPTLRLLASGVHWHSSEMPPVKASCLVCFRNIDGRAPKAGWALPPNHRSAVSVSRVFRKPFDSLTGSGFMPWTGASLRNEDKTHFPSPVNIPRFRAPPTSRGCASGKPRRQRSRALAFSGASSTCHHPRSLRRTHCTP